MSFVSLWTTLKNPIIKFILLKSRLSNHLATSVFYKKKWIHKWSVYLFLFIWGQSGCKSNILISFFIMWCQTQLRVRILQHLEVSPYSLSGQVVKLDTGAGVRQVTVCQPRQLDTNYIIILHDLFPIIRRVSTIYFVRPSRFNPLREMPDKLHVRHMGQKTFNLKCWLGPISLIHIRNNTTYHHVKINAWYWSWVLTIIIIK